MAITQNDLEILKSEIMADTPDGGGLPTGIAVIDGVSNNLFPDVSDIDRLIGRVRLRKVSLAVKTANAELLQAVRMLFTELPENPNISVFAFKASSFADRRVDAQNKIESYLAFGSKWAGHVLETQLTGQRVIQISLDKGDQVPAVGQPLVIVQNEGQSDEFYQYIRPLKVDTIERRFQRTVSETVTRIVATIEFGDTLTKTFNGLTVPEFYQNASTNRSAILREARVADAAQYYSASRLAEPVVAMTSRQVKLNSIYTQVVPSTQVETPLLQLDAANQITTQARGDGIISVNQSVTVATNTAFNIASGVAVGTISLVVGGLTLTDIDGELVGANNIAYASINYGIGQVTWYDNAPIGQQTITGTYKPASSVVRVAQTDYQIVEDNAGYNFVRQLGAEPTPNSLKISYTVQGNNYAVHDNGRGLLIDDAGNGRGTVQGATVLLTTAAIPDAGSYIVYSFGVGLGTTSYGSQTLPSAYHVVAIDGFIGDNFSVSWTGGKTATVSNGVVSGDATGTMSGGQLIIAPKQTVAKGTSFTITYDAPATEQAQTFKQSFAVGSAAGVFNHSFSLGAAVDALNLNIIFRDETEEQLKLSFGIKGGNELFIQKAFYPSYKSVKKYANGVETTELVKTWYESEFVESTQSWFATLNSSSINKATGDISINVSVVRKSLRSYTTTSTGGSGAFSIYEMGYKEVYVAKPLFIKGVDVSANVATTSARQQKSVAAVAGNLFVTPPQIPESPILSGSLFINVLGRALRDSKGQVKDGDAVVGSIDPMSGVIELNTWQAGVANTVSLNAMVRERDPLPLANVIFRAPVAPLKTASLQINAELEDGTTLSLSTDAQGGITGSKYAHGTVDFKAGFVALYFYEKLGITANPDVVNQPWYDAASIYMESGTNYINKPIYVKPDSIRYNAIAYSYLPLDKELIGLDPVRLPTDGRVPFVRKGDSIAITELKTMQLPTNAPNDLFDLGFERLSDVNLVDSTGKKVSFDYLDVDLDAGTLKLNGLFDVSLYTPPLTAKYRIMDIALVIETDISGRVTLSTPITHDYSTAAVFSSMLLAGDMQARAFNVFGQKSWGGVWSDSLVGDATTAQLQVTNNPIVVTNRDAITERWALVFTSQTAFNIIGQTVGQIGSGSTTTLTAPINPMTGYPYFTIPIAAWGLGWSANNVVRINTDAPKYPVWIGNAIQQHQGSSSDNYDFTIGYHANIDRERGAP